jgi:hypothetical protein
MRQGTSTHYIAPDRDAFDSEYRRHRRACNTVCQCFVMWRSLGRVCLSQMNGCHGPGKVMASPPSAPSPVGSTNLHGRHLATGDGTTTIPSFTTSKAYGKVHDFVSSKNKDGDDNGNGNGNGNNNKSDSTSSSSPATSRDVPRTIIVKRGDLMSSTTTPAKPTVGKLKARFPLEHQIKDSQGWTIWTPASKRSEYIPVVRANALLDSGTYVRTNNGESIAGTEAARRLLHGKKDLFVLLRYVKRPVLLHGHGIPRQVLEHLLTNAIQLLDSTNKANILRWVQTNDGSHGDRALAEWCVENLATFLVDGEEMTMSDLYVEAAQDFLLLYWTVMDRIIKRLCFKRVPVSWNVEFRRKASTRRLDLDLIFDFQPTDASVTLRGSQVELFFHAFFGA